jgi:choline dehydrogenase
MASNGFDVVVAGGGPAGCVLAARLSEESERSVCLVEAGPDYGPFAGGRWPAELLDATGIPETHDWRDASGSLPWARVIGGCSSHNACFVASGPASDYGWADGWSYDALRPGFARASRKIRVRKLEREEIGAWHRAFLDAAVATGVPESDDPSDPAQPVAVSCLTVNTVGTTRWNAALAYLDPARSRPNLTVIGDAAADRVLVDGGRVRGLRISEAGAPRELSAPLVVVTCGAYGSPALLLRSGIGPPEHLSEHGIPVIADVPGVGQGLVDHVRVGFAFSLKGEVLELTRDGPIEQRVVAQVLMKARTSLAPPDAPDLQMFPVARPLPEGGWEGRITVGLVGARSRGSVRLRSTDPQALPDVDSALLRDPDDLAAIVEGMEKARELAACHPLAGAIAAETEPGPGADLTDYARANPGSYYHPVGTCAIGSVVDERGAVHGVDGLHVADASVIPRSPHANPHLTVLAVAERMAEVLG